MPWPGDAILNFGIQTTGEIMHWSRDRSAGWNRLTKIYVAASLATLAVAIPSISAAQQTVSYTYDALGRVVTVQHSGTSNNTTTSFTYDKADNRTSISVTGSANFKVVVLPIAGFVIIPLQNNGGQ
jgi:YD repeat-containing protein